MIDDVISAFNSVDHRFEYRQLDVIAEALTYFHRVSFKKYDLKLTHLRVAGFANSIDNTVAFNPDLTDYREDFLFTVLHELRHIEQTETDLMRVSPLGVNDAEFLWTQTGYSISGSNVVKLTRQNIEHYQQLPWEADANGFAHYKLDHYIPKHPVLARGVVFCTIPINPYIKVAQDAVRISDHNKHRTSPSRHRRPA